MDRIFIPKDSELSKASISGDTTRAKLILANSPDVSCLLSHQNRDGKTALHESCIHSQQECVKILLEAGSNPNALKRADWTPLMLACTRDNLHIIQLLVEAGARLDLRNKDGWNAFMIACRQGNISILEYLIGSDMSVCECVSRNGRVPLHTAAINNKSKVFGFLLTHCSVDINTQDVCGVTPLMDACRVPGTEGLELLLEAGAATDMLDKSGRTALHIAAQAGSYECISLLVKTGLCVNSKALSNGFTPLHYAMREGHEMSVSALLTLGADVGSKDSYGRTPKELSDLCNSCKPIIPLVKK